MSWLRSILFALVFYPGTLFYVLLSLFTAQAGSARIRACTTGWARFHRRCCRYILGITSRIEGAPPTGAVLVASKHQSMYETVEFVLILHEPAIVLKQELADIPLWGKVAQNYGNIPIDRQGSAKALRAMLRAARSAIAESRIILIFPEGTRVALGEQPELKSGFAALYKQLNLPVSPVAVDSGHVWGRNSFFKKPGIVTFRFGELVPPGLPREEAEARVHAEINRLDSPAV